jgi:hypothetical protein
MSEAAGSAGSTGTLYENLKSNIAILSEWAKIPDNAQYKGSVITLVYGFKSLNSTDNDAIRTLGKAVSDVIIKIPIDKLPKGLLNAVPYDGGRRRKSASSSSRPRRRSSKKRGTQRKQKRRQRRGSRRA